LETVYKDYSSKGVKFYYLYKALAHPEWDGYVTPYTLDERFMHMEQARKQLQSDFSWIVDNMDNEIKAALGGQPNSEFLIDPQGKVVVKRAWSDPKQLRKDLAAIVGDVSPATTVAELNREPLDPPKAAATGVVPRLKVEGRMMPLRIGAHIEEGGDPFFAKLRVEADMGLIREGEGQLYLRFMMDPLYHVHWNNETPPIKVNLKAPEGVTLSENQLIGPEVEEEADIDPREFLIEVKRGDSTGPIELRAFYFACSTEEGWCKPFEQNYSIHLERDRNGGSVIRRGFPGAGGGRRQDDQRRRP